MLFSNLVSSEFANKVQDISNQLGVNPNWLMACMGFETGYTYKASIKNVNVSTDPNKQPTGLIQFLPSTANYLGTSIQELTAMSNVEQLDYVLKYYKMVQEKYNADLNSLGNMYMAIYLPAYISKDDSYIFPNVYYKDNKGFDRDNKGYITKGDVIRFITDKTNSKSGNSVDNTTDTDFINFVPYQFKLSYNDKVLIGGSIAIGLLLISSLVILFKRK